MLNFKQNLKKACLVLAFISTLTISSVAVKASDTGQLNGWVKQNESWYNYKDGFKQTGWLSDNGKWYFMYSNGKMTTSWTKINEELYYFYEDGSMAQNTIVDGNYIDANGACK